MKVILETLRRSIKSQMREANRCGARYVIIIGEDEITNESVIIKDMSTGKQLQVSNSNINKFFKSN